MTRYVAILGCLILATAALFSLGGRTGVHWYYMYGSIGIVVCGVVAAMALAAWQVLDGFRRLKDGLKALGPAVLVTEFNRRKAGKGEVAPPDLVVVTPGGVAVLVIDDVPDNLINSAARKRLQASAVRAQAGAEWVQQRHGGQSVPMATGLLLLRRLQGRDPAPPGVALVNPENLPAWLAYVLPGGHLEREQQVRLTQTYRAGSSR